MPAYNKKFCAEEKNPAIDLLETPWAVVYQMDSVENRRTHVKRFNGPPKQKAPAPLGSPWLCIKAWRFLFITAGPFHECELSCFFSVA